MAFAMLREGGGRSVGVGGEGAEELKCKVLCECLKSYPIIELVKELC